MGGERPGSWSLAVEDLIRVLRLFASPRLSVLPGFLASQARSAFASRTLR